MCERDTPNRVSPEMQKVYDEVTAQQKDPCPWGRQSTVGDVLDTRMWNLEREMKALRELRDHLAPAFLKRPASELPQAVR